MTKVRLVDATITQMFKSSMNATKSAANMRRARAEVRNLAEVAKVIHQDNTKHMYSKRIHKNAGEMLVESNLEMAPAETVISGPVEIKVSSKRQVKKAA